MIAFSRHWIGLGALALILAGSLSAQAQNTTPAAPRPPAATTAPAPAKPAVAAPAPAAAAKLKTPVIAVVDAQTILDKSDASKSARIKLEAIAADFQKKFDVEEEALKAEERALLTQQSILSADAYGKKRQDLQKKASDFERKVASARRMLTGARDGTARFIHAALVEVVGKMAEERGVDLVIPSSQLLFTTASLNLTNEAMTRLNKRLPDVPVELKEPVDEKR
jgi:Skp family chaperone for outer membrane proteins